MIRINTEDNESPEHTARKIIETYFKKMDENLRFKDEGYDEEDIETIEDFIQPWATYCSLLQGIKIRLDRREQDTAKGRLENIFPGITEDYKKIVDEKVALARNVPKFWDVAVLAVQHYSRIGIPLPQALADLVIDAMRGEAKRPTKRGRPANDDRDRVIMLAIDSVIESFPEISATRNEATETISACEIVADVLNDNGLILDSRSVEKIWSKRT